MAKINFDIINVKYMFAFETVNDKCTLVLLPMKFRYKKVEKKNASHIEYECRQWQINSALRFAFCELLNIIR